MTARPRRSTPAAPAAPTAPVTTSAPPGSIPLDVSGRPTALRRVDLDRFFHPRSVAVIGASTSGRSSNTVMWRKIRAWGDEHGASIIPVHPAHDELDGVRCFPSIADIPGEIDMAVILVGDAIGVFESVLAARPRFTVIFAAGFAETGAAGQARQVRLAQMLATSDVRLLGPNTNLNAFEAFRDDLAGPTIALITQSGHQGRPVFQAQELGIALSHWAPTGNEVDLEFADFVNYFADQAGVGVVAAYIEGFKDGRTLILAADRAARAGLPIVCVKVGRTDAGRSMARSHTGHLTGSDAVTSAVFAQYGITRVDGLDELTETAAMFARTAAPRDWKHLGTPRRRPLGVCVYSISGGTGAHMADLLAGAGVALPDLAPRTQRALRTWIPGELRVSNPVDSGGPPSMDERGRQILEALIADPHVDVIVCPITGAVDSISRPLATDLVAAAATTTKPIFVVWGSPDTADPVYRDILLASRLPTFRTFHNCVAATRAYADHWHFRARYESPFASSSNSSPSPNPSPGPRRATVPLKLSRAARTVRRLLADRAGDGRALSEVTAKEVLRAYGIPVTHDIMCGSAAEAARAAAGIDAPVVLKVVSPDLVHKSDLGLVQVGLATGAAVKRSYAELLDRALAVDPHARIEGVLVTEQLTGGVETVLGMTQDELFGPTIMFGLGGVFVEILGDVAFRVPPFPRAEAERMVREVNGYPLLQGARGTAAVDVDALVDVIMKLERLAMENADTIAEIDMNPLLVRTTGVVALDALIICA